MRARVNYLDEDTDLKAESMPYYKIIISFIRELTKESADPIAANISVGSGNASSP